MGSQWLELGGLTEPLGQVTNSELQSKGWTLGLEPCGTLGFKGLGGNKHHL